MARWYIKTRAEFFEVLAKTLEQARARNDGFAFAELQSITNWTANGRTPSDGERQGIRMGYSAVREIDALQDKLTDDEGEYLDRLIQLAGYFEEWPADGSPRR